MRQHDWVLSRCNAQLRGSPVCRVDRKEGCNATSFKPIAYVLGPGTTAEWANAQGTWSLSPDAEYWSLCTQAAVEDGAVQCPAGHPGWRIRQEGFQQLLSAAPVTKRQACWLLKCRLVKAATVRLYGKTCALVKGCLQTVIEPVSTARHSASCIHCYDCSVLRCRHSGVRQLWQSLS